MLNTSTGTGAGDEVLRHSTRYDHIVDRLLPGLDADIIGLQEVTPPLLQRLQDAEWVRRGYVLSMVIGGPDCPQMFEAHATRGYAIILLSRIAPIESEHLAESLSGRYYPVMTLELKSGTRVAVAAVHLKSFPWLFEGTRREELGAVTAELERGERQLRGGIVLGDHNFHREAENASIPDRWGEVPAVADLGATWSWSANAMIAHYLPLRNLYNGFGTGYFGWHTEMRLDRVLLHGDVFAQESADACLFGIEPIHERAKGCKSLPPTGPDLKGRHRSIPWEEYLFPSDHFGILVDMPLARL